MNPGIWPDRSVALTENAPQGSGFLPRGPITGTRQSRSCCRGPAKVSVLPSSCRCPCRLSHLLVGGPRPVATDDPRAEAPQAGAVPGPSAAGVAHEAAGQRDAASRAVARDKPVGDVGGHPAIMAGVDEVEVVVAHNERATLRVGDVFLKVDADQRRTDVEVEAMAMAPIPTPEVLWRKPPVLALAALPGTALGCLGEPSPASPAAWAAAGAAVRMLHEAPLPPWPGRSLDEIAARLEGECELLITKGLLPADLVTRNRQVAEAALRPWTRVFAHGDLQITHVFVDGDEVTGVIDWSEAAQGDALYDLATLTLGHEEHLGDVIAGYGGDVDRDVIPAGWPPPRLGGVRWLIEHGFAPASPGAEFAVLRSNADA